MPFDSEIFPIVFPDGGWPFVLVPRLYHGKAPWERWDIGDLVSKQEVNGVSHLSPGGV